MDKTKVAIVGLGTVGTGLARLLLDHGDRTARHAGRTLWLEAVVVLDVNKRRDVELPTGILTNDLSRITENREIIMLVVDGRQAASRGVDLDELAGILLDLGSVEAMNLDGGGSSTLVVDGVRLNRPVGKDSEREVASAVAVFCE